MHHERKAAACDRPAFAVARAAILGTSAMPCGRAELLDFRIESRTRGRRDKPVRGESAPSQRESRSALAGGRSRQASACPLKLLVDTVLDESRVKGRLLEPELPGGLSL